MSIKCKMIYTSIIALALSIGVSGRTASESFADKEIVLKTTNYDLDIVIDYESKILDGKCKLTLVNSSDQPVGKIPLLLYRMMTVREARDASGQKLSVRQKVQAVEDWEKYVLNFVEVTPATPIAPNESYLLELDYGGQLKGCVESGMLYVKDSIDPKFTILRPDAKTFPEIGYPSWKVNRAAGLGSYDYLASVTVPEDLVVANGGELVSREVHNGQVTYTYRNIKTAWRIDLAIADYGVLESGPNRVYYFPEDSAGAQRVMKAMTASLELFTKWFGELHDFKGFAVLEIPPGFGSQADVTSIMQDAAAFTDESQVTQLYHEVSHQWNARDIDKFPSRWNEGLATFLESLAAHELDGHPYSLESADKTMADLRKTFENNPDWRTVSFIDYGKEGVTRLSYGVGGVFFKVLYELMGREELLHVIAGHYQKFVKSGGSTDDLADMIKERGSEGVDRFVDEWIYTTMPVEMIEKGMTARQIVAHYQE